MVSVVEFPIASARVSSRRPGPAALNPAVTAERHRAILRLLAESGRVTLANIAERFGVSAATARRDALLLTRMGRAARCHGALATTTSGNAEPHFRARSIVQTSAKTLIAQRAVQLLPTDGIVFVDAGTTCLEVGRALLERPGLQIVTNSIPLLELAVVARARLISLGGEVRRTSLALTGGFTQTWLNNIRFDAAVIGAAGVDPQSGAYTSELHEAGVKSDALRRASVRMLAADGSKWGRPTAVHFAPWSAFTYFVSNQLPPEEGRRNLLASSVTLQLAA